MEGTAPTSTQTKKKLHIVTWGCQMNVYDSTRMGDLLAPLGYESSETPDDADLVILNTCHIREKASEKIFSELGRLHKRQKTRAPGNPMMIGVAGCVAQAEGDQILKRAPFVDMVFGPQTYHRLPEMVVKAMRGKGGVIDTDFPLESKFDHLPIDTQHQGASAFLSIQEGCDKFCTFCVVPYTRGSEYSRSSQAVIDEAKRLIDKGAREITLLGQNVNAYHGEDHGVPCDFAALIEKMATLNGLQRIRYTTSHPRDMNDALVAAHRDIPQLMPFIHLPVQSGSTRILQAMNRKHSREEYLAVIEKFRVARPDIAFSSDFIIGFPGETDQDFQDTLALIRDVKFAQAYSFKYSPRPGTPAAIMQAQVPEDVKDARLQEVQALLLSQQREYNESFMGKTVSVLFDRRGRHDNQIIGRTPYMQSVYVEDAGDLFGTTADVVVNHINPNAMKASVIR